LNCLIRKLLEIFGGFLHGWGESLLSKIWRTSMISLLDIGARLAYSIASSRERA
jgi:hypothetical protein